MRGGIVPRWARSVRVMLGLAIVLGLLGGALFAPLLAPHDPAAQDLAAVLQPVRLGSAWPLGTDGLGRCVLSRLLHGMREAMLVAVAAGLGAMLLGGGLGVAAGYLGGRLDRAVGAAEAVWTAVPPAVWALVLMAGLGEAALAIALAGWGPLCRALRADVAAVTRCGHVATARQLGVSRWRVLRGEVLPVVLPRVLVLLMLAMGGAVGAEAMLGFVGPALVGSGGVPEPAGWGRMVADGRDAAFLAPMGLLAPCAAIGVAGAGFNLLGWGLRRTLGLRRAGHRLAGAGLAGEG